MAQDNGSGSGAYAGSNRYSDALRNTAGLTNDVNSREMAGTARNRRLSESQRNGETPHGAFPAAIPADNPPLEEGKGWLAWLDEKVTGLFDAGFDGVKESFEHPGQSTEQPAPHHHDHNNIQTPQTPSADPHPVLSGGRNSGSRTP